MMPFPVFFPAQAVAGSPSLPAGISPYAWYDGSQETGSNNSQITTLADRSGNGRDFTSTATPGPLVKTADLNGRNTIRLGRLANDTVNGTVLQRANTFLSGVTAASMFMVFKAIADPATGSGNGGPFGAMHNFGDTSFTPWTDGKCYVGFCSTTRKNFNPTPVLTDWHIWGEHSAASDYAVRFDGTVEYSTTTNTVGVNSSSKYIGTGQSSVSSPYWDGWLAEVLFFDSVLGTSDRQKVEGYLAHKWGLTANLDSGHPYKSTPPT